MMRQKQIAWGSEEHAALLGLVKTAKSEANPEGYALADPTQWGPAATDKFLEIKRQQALAVLRSKPEVTKNAPPLWTPKLWRKEQAARLRREREMAEEEA